MSQNTDPNERHVTHLGNDGQPDHTVHSTGDSRFSYDSYHGSGYHDGHISQNGGYRGNNPQDVGYEDAPWDMFPPPGF